MTIVSTWKSMLNDWQNTYYDSHTEQRQPVKQDDGLSVKFIVILVLVSFFAFVIFCLLMAVLWKWVMTRTKKKDENSNPHKPHKKRSPSSSFFNKPGPPSDVKLMRNDSSLSEIEVSRDSSLPPTPLSPLSEEDAVLFPFERGRLEFSVSYDPNGECLKTTVVQAHDLPQRHCIFYVEGILLPEKASKQQTSIRYHNPSPIFEETFQFDLPYAELPERTLCFKVYEIDSFSQHLLIGHVLHSFDVEKDNYFNPMKMDLELMRGLPQDKMEYDVGELLMSLCYLPTAGRLTLVVLKCRLTKASNGLPSPFLKVSLVLNRKQVKKIKTSVKKKTLSPVYNEAFIFDVPSQHIGNVGLYTRVVNDRDEQELMGKVVIGPNSKTSMGIHHWECMLMSPRKPIAQWHTIM